jgi:hypothetical protein
MANPTQENQSAQAAGSVPAVVSDALLDCLDTAYDLANHGIPFYAYGDNEAACDMASRLEQIGHELRYVRDLINTEVSHE